MSIVSFERSCQGGLGLTLCTIRGKKGKSITGKVDIVLRKGVAVIELVPFMP